MSQVIAQRLQQIRAFMQAKNLDAFIIPRADEYLGEYVPACNERLLWVSGFTGSAGAAVILADKAAIFVDGRYTVQVRQQVDAQLYSFHHLIEEPYLFWTCQNLDENARIGIDSRTFSLSQYRNIKALIDHQHLELVESENPVDALWQDRPDAPSDTATLMPNDWAGQTSLEKREQIAEQIRQSDAQAALITAPDSIAWLLNIRGSDIAFLPVALSSSILFADGTMHWYVNPKKIPQGFAQHVGKGVTTYPEDTFEQGLNQLAQTCQKVLADPSSSNAWSQLRLTDNGVQLVALADPCVLPKAAKNESELKGTREAHRKDALAEVRFLAWLDKCAQQNNLPDEGQAADKLQYFRYLDKDCIDLSFATISAAAVNAAMCHYNHKNADTPAPLLMNSSYLVDSGGQYRFGTTDITRTVALGTPPQETKERFTQVLKGMIALTQARFPKGTTGTQLDVLARQYLWQHGLDFDHGTGHGVGHFLSVHEGPQRISKALNDIALEPGMITSNEPGFYKENEYGIRCENLLVVENADLPDADRPFYQFATLTYVPFDKRLMQLELLTDTERAWINDYHQQVRELVKPQIPEDETDVLDWLINATSAL
ncbi:aminopeptidase P family protein [Celerinatantimonas sp. MCCC 1A17872]|uniref:aminopeptidase P family protein n=1 Tax=Celerinatantimonas sp. MCCC 1A17872 TaxID=3177514 RepID=UPI0038C2519C